MANLLWHGAKHFSLLVRERLRAEITIVIHNYTGEKDINGK